MEGLGALVVNAEGHEIKPTILSINELVKAIVQVATSLKTRMWGGLHSCLALVLRETEIRKATT